MQLNISGGCHVERKRNTRPPWAFVLLIVILSCAIAYCGALIVTRVSRASSFGSIRTVTVDGLQRVEAVKDGFVYYDGSAIGKVNESGDTVWSYMMGSNAEFSASDAGVAAWTGEKLTLLAGSSGAADFAGNMDETVLSATVGTEYAAVLIGEEHNSTIVLMETGGRKVDSISLSDQTVIDYGFFYNDTLFWVMTLDTNGTTPSCTVSTYRPGRRQVGSISDGEQLLYHLEFQSTQICVTGETYIKVFDYSGTEIKDKRTLVYGWTLADADSRSSDPMMAFAMNGQNTGDVLVQDVRMIRGSNDQIVRMPYGCAKIIARGDRVYGFSSEGYVMIAKMGQQKVDAYAISTTFSQVYGVTNNNVAVLGYDNAVYLVSLE